MLWNRLLEDLDVQPLQLLEQRNLHCQVDDL